MKTTRLVLIVLVVALCLQAAAWSQDGARRPRAQAGQRGMAMMPPCVTSALMRPPPQIIENQATRLELTDEQKQKLKTALETARTNLDPLRKTSGDAIAQLRRGLFDATKDAAAVKALADAATKAECDVATAELAAWTEIRSILNAGQLTRLGEMMGRGRRTGPGPGGPQPPPDGAAPPPPPPAQQ